MSVSNDDINKVLYYSYIPDCRQSLPDEFEKAAKKKFHSDSYETLINKGKVALENTFDKIINNIENDKRQVIPLSSGLDSRTILGQLLTHPDIDNENIHTVTLGSPNTYDFKYGQEVAELNNIKNTTINLQSDEFDWSLEALCNFANSERYQSPGRILDKYIISKIFEVPERNAVFWSGFMGGETAGSHLPEKNSKDWKKAINWYTQWERYTNHSELVLSDWDPSSVLPENPYISESHLWYEVQIDFTHRQQCLIKNIVQAERCQTPYIQSDWLDFILNVPYNYRRNRMVFKDILKEKFPELANIPSDTNNGLPLTASRPRQQIQRINNIATRRLFSIAGRHYNPHMNYIDFESELREGGCLYPATKQLIHDFFQRDIAEWFNPHDIWQKHQSGKNLANEIRVILSLELYIR